MFAEASKIQPLLMHYSYVCIGIHAHVIVYDAPQQNIKIQQVKNGHATDRQLAPP